jgi:uncharacterized membrane protein YkgB
LTRPISTSSAISFLLAPRFYTRPRALTTSLSPSYLVPHTSFTMDAEVSVMTSSHLDLERRLEDSLPARLRRPIDTIDSAVTTVLQRYGISALRIALAVVFIWFGTLKVIDRSPVEDLVKDTIYFLPEDTFFIIIGVWEIIIGIGLLVPVALRLTLLLFWMQMAGTFLSLIILPGRAFQDGNPLLLTVTGEFVIKNLVLIAAGLVIGSTVRRRALPKN